MRNDGPIRHIRVAIEQHEEAEDYVVLRVDCAFGERDVKFQQPIHRATLEDQFESHFNVLFDLIRRRILGLYAKATGRTVREPFYGITFGESIEER